MCAALIGGLASSASPQEAPDTLTANWPLRVGAEEAGFVPFAVWQTETWAVARGGLEQRGWWNSLLDFGFELNTANLGWWEGGTFMAQVYWGENLHEDRSLSDYTGAFNPVSNIEAGDQLRVFNLHYRQSWKEETIVLKIGQLAIDDDFMLSDYAGLFLNSAFGAMPSQIGTPLATSLDNMPAYPIYPVAAPGFYIHVRPLEPAYLQLGLYYGRPGFDERDNHGFDWIEQTPPELGLFWEGGYCYPLAGHPAITRVGLSYHTGELNHYGNDHQGMPTIRQSAPNIYFIQDFELLSDREGNPKLGLFGRVGFTPEPDRALVDWYADGGLNWFAPLPCRSADIAGIGVSHTAFGKHYRRRSGPNPVAEGETTIELTYKAELTAWLSLQADVQWLFDPAINPDSGSRETATVLGMRAEIRF